MPLTNDNKGTNADGSNNEDYCAYCYKDGKFTNDFTMSQMIEFCAQFTDQINSQAGWNLTPEEAKEQMRKFFPQLKRWKDISSKTLFEKAAELLAQCSNITIASVDADGYPRPVVLSKIQAKGCNEVWMATAADSIKIADFKNNDKAGLCYESYGDSVALRGVVNIVTDEKLRKELWQEWFIHHFPEGPTDSNYVLLHFVGSEATIWINGEFSHERV